MILFLFKVLIIGGGIANFTDIAETFKGIVKAIRVLKDKLLAHNVRIFVRRGGPNYQEGLRFMQESVEALVRLSSVCLLFRDLMSIYRAFQFWCADPRHT
jgi:succinyl-CoA synthetase beta subunit